MIEAEAHLVRINGKIDSKNDLFEFIDKNT